MGTNELVKVAQKLSKSGMTDRLKNGREALPVSLMIPERPQVTSRGERKAYLEGQFKERLNDCLDKGVEVDFGSVSVSGQTINAKLDIDQIDTLSQDLASKNLEIRPNLKTSVTLD